MKTTPYRVFEFAMRIYKNRTLRHLGFEGILPAKNTPDEFEYLNRQVTLSPYQVMASTVLRIY